MFSGIQNVGYPSIVVSISSLPSSRPATTLLLSNEEYDFDLDSSFAGGSPTVKGVWPVTAAFQLQKQWLVMYSCVLRGRFYTFRVVFYMVIAANAAYKLSAMVKFSLYTQLSTHGEWWYGATYS